MVVANSQRDKNNQVENPTNADVCGVSSL